MGVFANRRSSGAAQTAYDRHTFRVLNVVDEVPWVETVYFYREGFLISGNASSSLKPERILS